MHDLYNLKDALIKELGDYGKEGGVTRSNIEMIDKLAHAAKNVSKVIECCEDEEYSMAYGPSYSRRYSSRDYVRPDGSYRDGGSSYARGRGSSAKRDSMGRYSREGESMDSNTKEELMKLIEKM